AEHDEARRVLGDLRVSAALRRSRRLTRARTARRRPDVRRTMRAALRTEGEPLRRAWRSPTTRERRLVVLCDVSGAMEPYAVVLLADGWGRGEPELLGEQMARLARVAHRIVWVNPLKATPGFAPLAAGMAAALPYVDDFVEGHSIASLTELAGIIAAVDA